VYTEIDDRIRFNEEITMFKNEVHRFAKEVVRPAAWELDKMDSKDAAAKDSPYFDVMRKMKKNGYHRLFITEENGGDGAGADEFNILFEELGWGSVGFATAIGVDMLAPIAMDLIGTPEIQEEVLRPWMADEGDKYHGCWAVMDPDRGSDYVIGMTHPNPEEFGIKGFCRADRDGDDWVLNGSKSYWTSSGPVSTWVMTHPVIPPHEKFTDLGAAVLPLDLPGVTVMPPIDKLGTRDDPQGQIIFDNVRIPNHYMVAQVPALSLPLMKMIISCSSCGMASFYTGLARAAFEETLKYCYERVQGNKPLIEHQLTQYRVYKMFEKIETSRAYVRSVIRHVWREVIETREFGQSTPHALVAQAYCKDMAFAVAHECVQLHGGMGITKDMLVEKLFRDARCGLIEDGSSEILGLEAAADLLAEETYTLD